MENIHFEIAELKKEVRTYKTLLFIVVITAFIIIGNIWRVASARNQELIDLKEQNQSSSIDNKYTIILNDDWEAMPGENGLLRVDFFKGDTVYVLAVEELK